MRFSNIFAPTSALLVLTALSGSASSYFVITEPTRTTTWVNGAANVVTWSKGLFDGVDFVDIEMSRLNTDGLTLIARNTPVKPASLNIYLDSLPTGDDYFLLFINVTHGGMYATSPRFTIADSANSSSTQPKPNAAVPTVTVSGAPNPTIAFATTFPASANGAVRWDTNGLLGVGGAFVGCAISAAWTLW